MSANIVWQGTPSQWSNFPSLALTFLLVVCMGAVDFFYGPMHWLPMFASAARLGYVMWRFFVIRCYFFKLTDEQLLRTTGVCNQTVECLELYRVRDIGFSRGFVQRLLGLQTVVLYSDDASAPVIRLPHIHFREEFCGRLRDVIEACRRRNRVRNLEVNDASGLHG